MPRMIIANRLADGRIVFLADEGRWVSSIEEGLLLDEDTAAEAHFGRAKQHEIESVVIDPNLIDVAVDGGRRRPTEIREAIRAFGPTLSAQWD